MAMSHDSTFSLSLFLPYLLNQAAETASREFEQHYRARYGMLRTEWRVLFHLGLYGDMTAKRICDLAALHKTKVSRAVAALEEKRLLTRETIPSDRRNERLSLTRNGRSVFAELEESAKAYDAKLTQDFNEDEARRLRQALMRLAGLSENV